MTRRPAPLIDTIDDDYAMDKLQSRTPVFVFVLTVFSAIGGFLFGYDTGVIAGAMLLLKDSFGLTSLWQSLIVSITVAFAALFAMVGGLANDHLGRKPVIFCASFVFTAGALIMGLSTNKYMLFGGRIVIGAGIGLASMTVPMYIAECAPIQMRGRLVTINNLFITGGQCVAAVIDGLFSKDADNGWRYMLGLAGVPSLIQFIGFMFMPESPRWLIIHGQYEKAREVLRSIRGSTLCVDDEFETIKQNCLEIERERQERASRKPLILQMLQTPSLQRALLVGCGLQMFQQLAGINTVMYYGATIIEMAGVKTKSQAIWLNAAVAGVNFICTIFGVYLVEKIGRRLLTLGSMAGVVLSLAVLAIGFQLTAFNSPPITYKESGISNPVCGRYNSCNNCIQDRECGFCFEDLPAGPANGSCLPTNREAFQRASTGRCKPEHLEDDLYWAYEYCPTPYSWTPIVGLVLYLFFFAPGMGPMPWTVNSEIYPHWARSTGNAAATAVNWIFNLTVSMSFLALIESITTYGTFWLFCGVALIGFIFIFIFLPETKGKSLEEVEGLFAQPLSSDGRGNGTETSTLIDHEASSSENN